MIESRFIYFGNASGASARITRIDAAMNLNHLVPVQGASSLPPVGGLSESRAGNFNYSVEQPRPLKLFSLGSAHTRAMSDPPDSGKSFTTEVAAQVEQVTFLEEVHADLVRANLKSVHGTRDPFPTITPFDSEIVGLQLGKTRVDVEIDMGPFQQCGTKAALAELYAKDPGFRKENFRRFNADYPDQPKLPERKGYVIGSIVKSIRFEGKPPDDTVVDGYTIIWKQFGRIILGEIVITDSYRRLTMLRVEMGSPTDGKGGASDAQVNGVTMS